MLLCRVIVVLCCCVVLLCSVVVLLCSVVVLLCSVVVLLCSVIVVYCCVPGGADHAGQQRPLLLQSELHDSRSLKLLSDPLALLQVVDEHELHTDVLTVRHLTNQQHR